MRRMRPTRIPSALPARRGRRRRLVAGAALAALAVGAACTGGVRETGAGRTATDAERVTQTRPNIVWIVADVVNAASAIESFGGTPATISETAALTSDLATARAALLTGVSPSALGIDQRTGRFAAPPPAGLKVLPEQLRRAGYYTSRAGPPGHNLGFRAIAPRGDRARGRRRACSRACAAGSRRGPRATRPAGCVGRGGSGRGLARPREGLGVPLHGLVRLRRSAYAGPPPLLRDVQPARGQDGPGTGFGRAGRPHRRVPRSGRPCWRTRWCS